MAKERKQQDKRKYYYTKSCSPSNAYAVMQWHYLQTCPSRHEHQLKGRVIANRKKQKKTECFGEQQQKQQISTLTQPFAFFVSTKTSKTITYNVD